MKFTDLSMDAKFSGHPAMVLLGFKPVSRIKPWYNIRHPYFLHPSDETIGGSVTLCAALIIAMQTRETAAIVRWVHKQTSQVRLAALLPQMEVLDDDLFQIKPPGFHMIPLPYREDIRQVSIVGTKPNVDEQIAREQVKCAMNVLREISVEEFKPELVDNPVIQKHYAGLEALAMNESRVQEPPDYLLPDLELMNSMQAKVVEWKDSVFSNKQSSSKVSRPRGSPSKDDSTPPKPKRRAQDGPIDIPSLAKEGKLESLTVPKLKEWLALQRLTVSGNKSDLILRVKTKLGID